MASSSDLSDRKILQLTQYAYMFAWITQINPANRGTSTLQKVFTFIHILVNTALWYPQRTDD